jgi:hypothetical protein
MTFKINTDKTAAVATEVFWLPIDKDTPVGVKMLVINKEFGVAVISSRYAGSSFTHWAPLPKFKE